MSLISAIKSVATLRPSLQPSSPLCPAVMVMVDQLHYFILRSPHRNMTSITASADALTAEADRSMAVRYIADKNFADFVPCKLLWLPTL